MTKRYGKNLNKDYRKSIANKEKQQVYFKEWVDGGMQMGSSTHVFMYHRKPSRKKRRGGIKE